MSINVVSSVEITKVVLHNTYQLQIAIYCIVFCLFPGVESFIRIINFLQMNDVSVKGAQLFLQ